MEVVITKYSPTEEVTWEREKDGVTLCSNHTVIEVKVISKENDSPLTKKNAKDTFGMLGGIMGTVLCSTQKMSLRRKRLAIDAFSGMGKAVFDVFISDKEELFAPDVKQVVKYKLKGVRKWIEECELRSFGNSSEMDELLLPPNNNQ